MSKQVLDWSVDFLSGRGIAWSVVFADGSHEGWRSNDGDDEVASGFEELIDLGVSVSANDREALAEQISDFYGL